MMLYEHQKYDSENPWDGLFRSRLLLSVSPLFFSVTTAIFLILMMYTGLQAYFHFTKLRGEGSESDEIMQCSYTWNDPGYYGFFGVCSYTGVSDATNSSKNHH
jgi:hypothetical protein